MNYYVKVFMLLDSVWRENKELFPDELPGWLGGMQLLVDGNSADPAMLDDWLDLFDSKNISHNEAYDRIEIYLKRYMNSSSKWQPMIEILHQEETKAMWEILISNNSHDGRIYFTLS